MDLDNGKVDELVKTAKGVKSGNRLSAIKELGELNARNASDVLLEILRNDVPDVQCAAAVALAKIAGVKALNQIEGLLDNQNWHLREAAVKAIGIMEATQMLERVETMKNDRAWGVRVAAEEVSRKLGAVKTREQ